MAVIFPETTLPFYEDSGLYGFETTSDVRLFDLESGDFCEVVFDGVAYKTQATVIDIDGSDLFVVGNLAILGLGEDTGEPFVFLEQFNGTAYGYVIGTILTGETHTIGINTVEEGSTEPPIQEGIVLKDYAGNEVIYSEVKSIKIPTSSGGTQMFVAGNPVEKVVALEMADGDQVIEAEENTLLKKVVVRKPETLIPENIAKDVEIGGVVGTHEGGGGEGEGEEIPTTGYMVSVYDYDGRIIKQTKLATGEVFTLPNAPIHERLTFSGWATAATVSNNTVTVEKTDIDIGATYYPSSGAIEVDIETNETVGLVMTFSGVFPGYTSIDWGDGTVNSGTLTHTYAEYGSYTIKVYGATGLNTSQSNPFSKTPDLVVGVFLPSQITQIKTYTFNNHKNLRYICMTNVTVISSSYAFQYCYALRYVIAPFCSGIGSYTFQHCYALKTAIFPRVSTVNSYAFRYCYGLEKIALPSLSSIGSYGFYDCKSCVEFDFTKKTSIPSLGQYGMGGLPTNSKFKISASLYDSWKAASNWSTYAKYIVAV